MIRQAHQIAQILFLEESEPFNITKSQYCVLGVLQARSGLDQNGLARILGKDRSTTALVIGKLIHDGLVEGSPDAKDRRRRELALTDKGHALLTELVEPLSSARARLMSAFSAADGVEFLRLLRSLLLAFKDIARAPKAHKPKRKLGLPRAD